MMDYFQEKKKQFEESRWERFSFHLKNSSWSFHFCWIFFFIFFFSPTTFTFFLTHLNPKDWEFSALKFTLSGWIWFNIPDYKRSELQFMYMVGDKTVFKATFIPIVICRMKGFYDRKTIHNKL